MPVNSERKDYEAMKGKWGRLRDCSNGRDAVLAAGNKYVPDLPGADVAGNKAYRERGSFYNAVSRTVQGMNGMIFQAPPKVEFPATFEDMLDDVTLNNVPFEMFAVEGGKEIMLLARYGILIDMPNVPATDNRPYLVGYTAENIINWRTERRGGDDVLSMIVLKETVDQPKEGDRFCTETIQQYRVLWMDGDVCKMQKYRPKQDTKGMNTSEWVTFEEEVTLMRRGQALDFIPFVFMGQNHASADIQMPVLLDLADINLAHWRNSVDHEYGLHLVALPTPWVSGPKAAPDGVQMKIGPSVVWELEKEGSAGMLEFSGSGLAALREAMNEKKKQMATHGARLLEDANGLAETATAVRMRHSGEQASLKTIAGAIEQGFTLALKIFVWWAGTAPKPSEVTDVNVELNKEYLNIKASPQEIQVMLTALQAGEISYETWWNFVQNGGWGREGVDAETEKKAIATDAAMKPEPVEDPALSPPEEIEPPDA